MLMLRLAIASVALGALAVVLGAALPSAGAPPELRGPSVATPPATAAAPVPVTDPGSGPARAGPDEAAGAPTVPSAGPQDEPAAQAPGPPAVAWRASRAIGQPNGGQLVAGVQLPAWGRDFWTWDPVHKERPNRGWRRWGTDRLVRTLLDVLRDYRRRDPDAPPVGIGDLSRPRGGDFGARFGNLGHASHQNGLDADLYYPRKDRRLRRPHEPRLVDRRLAQELVDAFVRSGAQFVFVGPRLGLRGPPSVVQPLRHHDDHLHVRIR